MEAAAAEIAQISVYLAKDQQTFDSVIDPEANLYKNKSVRQHDFAVGEIACRFIFFETNSFSSNPTWLDFANEQLPTAEQIKFSSASKSPNGLLLMLVSGRVFAATFGRSAGSQLHSRALEPDFGIKTAMNMCGNEEIRQTKSQSNTITPTHIDRQVNKPSDTWTFGLSEAEDLRYISAHIKGNTNVTLQGRDSLTVKIIGDEKLSWERLIVQCHKFLLAYDSKDYINLFPNYKNFRVASDAEIDELDKKLVESLQSENFDLIRLSIPEFLSDDEYRFSYTNKPTKENMLHSFLDARQLKDVLPLDVVTVHILQNRRIWAYSTIEDRILPYRKWRIYNCLSFEQKLDDKYFILNDGRWVEVDSEFYTTIRNFMDKVLHEEPCEDAYKGIDISDVAQMRNSEAIFNIKVCEQRQTNILFDRAKLKIGTGRRDKEFCDILDMQDDSRVRIINCKPYKDATSVNYLFSQAKFYCDAFLHDETFLAEIREHIQKSNNTIKDKYLAYIPADIENLTGKNYNLCLWLLYDQNDKAPTRSTIPLISQYELKLMHDHLRKTCKLNDIILRFVPVKMTNFQIKKTPKKIS